MAFFQEEIDTCKLYSMNTGEYLCTYERMWAACTSIVDAKYSSPFTDDMKSKLTEYLLYNDEELGLDESATLARYAEVWHKDNVVEKAAITTEIPFTYLSDGRNYFKTKNALALVDETMQVCTSMFLWDSPTDVYFDKIYCDQNCNTIGLSVSPTALNPEYLADTHYSRINAQLRKKSFIYLDYDIYSDREEIVLTTRVRWHPQQYEMERNLNVDAITEMGDFKFAQKDHINDRHRSMMLNVIRSLDIITDEQEEWLLNLFDHDEQEFDLDYVFNKDGSLKDIIVLKREARDFKIWRSEPS